VHFFDSEGNEPLEQCTKVFYGYFEEFFSNVTLFLRICYISKGFISEKSTSLFLNRQSACVIKLLPTNSTVCRTHDKALSAQIFGNLEKI